MNKSQFARLSCLSSKISRSECSVHIVVTALPVFHTTKQYPTEEITIQGILCPFLSDALAREHYHCMIFQVGSVVAFFRLLSGNGNIDFRGHLHGCTMLGSIRDG